MGEEDIRGAAKQVFGDDSYDQHAQRPYGTPPEEPSFPKWSDDLSELRDPVDMIKVEHPVEHEINDRFSATSALIHDALTGLKEADDQNREGNASWVITNEYMRAQSYAQVAMAQAAHISALELGQIEDHLNAIRTALEDRPI